jgi:hypothetical protein
MSETIPPFLRLATSAAVLGGLWGAADEAHAVDLGGGRFELVLQKPQGDGFVDMSTTDVEEFFNLANCECPTEFAVELTLRGVSAALPSQAVEVWVGTNCDDATDVRVRDSQCFLVTTIADVNLLKTPTTIPILAADLMWPHQDTCSTSELSRNIYVLVDDNGDYKYENVATLDPAIFVDTEAPPLPISPSAKRGEEAAVIEWTLPEGNTDDIRSFQILCARADGSSDAADELPRAKPAFVTPYSVCGMVTDGGGSTGADAGANDGGGGGADAGAVDAAVDSGADSDGASSDAGATAATLENLDAAFVCSEEIGGTEQSARITGLEDGVEYRIVLVTIDPRRNPTAIELERVTPRSVTDFWEDYKDHGGLADGEFCFVATAAYGDYDHPFVRVLRDFRDDTLAGSPLGRALIAWYYRHSPPLARFIAAHASARIVAIALLVPIVGAAAVWEYTSPFGKLGLALALLLLGRLRSIRPRQVHAPARLDPEGPRVLAGRRARVFGVAGAALALLVLASRAAAAQPYWDEPGGPADRETEARLAAPIEPSRWTFELRFGPYRPEVDSEFTLAGGELGPFATMFGDDSDLMMQLELDRYLLYPAGQLGVAAGLGYLRTSANAFEIDDAGDILIDENGKPVRSPGDETSFRLLPLWAGVVYRFTHGDDRWGVPIVPYVKGGLSYSLWWITRPDGAVAYVPVDPACEGDTCERIKARGGTLGWQASLGLSIRAERFDAKAARSLQSDLGVEHAGFFFEACLARANGLGMADKLRVGDLTWFGGVNFEF